MPAPPAAMRSFEVESPMGQRGLGGAGGFGSFGDSFRDFRAYLIAFYSAGLAGAFGARLGLGANAEMSLRLGANAFVLALIGGAASVGAARVAQLLQASRVHRALLAVAMALASFGLLFAWAWAWRSPPSGDQRGAYSADSEAIPEGSEVWDCHGAGGDYTVEVSPPPASPTSIPILGTCSLAVRRRSPRRPGASKDAGIAGAGAGRVGGVEDAAARIFQISDRSEGAFSLPLGALGPDRLCGSLTASAAAGARALLVAQAVQVSSEDSLASESSAGIGGANDGAARGSAGSEAHREAGGGADRGAGAGAGAGASGADRGLRASAGPGAEAAQRGRRMSPLLQLFIAEPDADGDDIVEARATAEQFQPPTPPGFVDELDLGGSPGGGSPGGDPEGGRFAGPRGAARAESRDAPPLEDEGSAGGGVEACDPSHWTFGEEALRGVPVDSDSCLRCSRRRAVTLAA